MTLFHHGTDGGPDAQVAGSGAQAGGVLLDRRGFVLKVLAAGAGAATAAALAPAEAIGYDGEVVRVGQLMTTGAANPVFNGINTGDGPGMIVEAAKHDAIRAYGNGAGRSALYATHSGDGWGVYGSGHRAGVHGDSDTGPGVHGVSATGDGLAGQAKAANKSGVYAFNDHAWGYGVYARGGMTGVRAHSDTGIGLRASSAAQGGIAIYCSNEGPTGTGIVAFGGKRGVVGGASSAAAVGVSAQNMNGGVALEVVGKTKLQRSGVATTVVGSAYKNITVSGGLTTASKFLVTMQGSPGVGVYVTYAKRISSTQFRVQFNKACTAAAKLAWMVLD